MDRIKQLEADRDDRRKQIKEFLAAASKDKRNFTEEEQTKVDVLTKELDQIAATLKHEQSAADWDRQVAQAIDRPADDPKAVDAKPKPRKNPWLPEGVESKDPLAGLGEFLQGVAAAYRTGKVDPRLISEDPKAAASGLNTSVPSEGGYLVRTDFSTALLERAMEESVLAQRCTAIEIGESFDGIEMPRIDETSRANGSRWGGIQVFRRAEADTVSASKPKLDMFELRLEDMMGICYATDRSLRDAVVLAQIIERGFSSEFAFKLDDEIIRGTGAGQCLGILNSPALVSQAAEGSQTADTVVAENVVKMRARVRARNRGRMAWFINQEVEPQLPFMVVKVKNVAGTENVGGAPIYMPANGLSVDGFDTLFGKSVIPIEQASAIGDVGDIMALDLGEYLLIRKGGIQAAQSMHVRFLYGENTFRFTYSVNGAPTWKSALTPYKGASTLSPFVTLAAR